jgi:hypothetical protein
VARDKREHEFYKAVEHNSRQPRKPKELTPDEMSRWFQVISELTGEPVDTIQHKLKGEGW